MTGVSFSRYIGKYAVHAAEDSEVREARYEGARGKTYARPEERDDKEV